MNAIERGLKRPIPLEKAAAYFVNLKSFARPSQEDDELLAACVKQAAADQAPQRAPLAEEAPADAAAVDPQPFLNVKSAALRFRLLAESFKKQAANETPPSADSADAALASPTPAAVPPKDDYLANEAAGIEAEATAALAYYQQRLEQERAAAAAAQEQAQQAQAQLEQLSAQQEQHQMQLSAAQQEGQIAQQAAIQQVESANLMATQAMQQAVQASNQALQAKGQEAAAKIEVQGVRSQLFDLASQGLPGTEPALGAEGTAAAGMEPLAPEAPAEGDPAAAEGAEGAPAEGGEEAPAEEGGGEEEAAATEGAPDAGLNQAGESASSDGMPGQEGPTEQAAAAPPGSAQPEAGGGGSAGGASTGPQSSSSDSTSSSDAKRQGQISIKVGTAQERRAKIAAAIPGIFKDPGVVGALAGGALGAGGAALEAHGKGVDLDKMRGNIAEREAAPKRPGLRGFGDALSLVQEKAKLGLGEATQSHPGAATIVGGLGGAALGASAGPRIADLVREAVSHHKGA